MDIVEYSEDIPLYIVELYYISLTRSSNSNSPQEGQSYITAETVSVKLDENKILNKIQIESESIIANINQSADEKLSNTTEDVIVFLYVKK